MTNPSVWALLVIEEMPETNILRGTFLEQGAHRNEEGYPGWPTPQHASTLPDLLRRTADRLQEMGGGSPIVSDPALVTQEKLVRLDLELTAYSDLGFPTAELTNALDDLWQHLREANQAVNLPEEHLAAIRAEYKEEPFDTDP